MTNVFKKRTRLCALTTSALFFLQAVNVSVGAQVRNDIQGNDIQGNDIQGNDIQGSGIRGNDIRGSGIRGNGIQDNSIQDNSIQDNGIRDNGIRDNGINSIPSGGAPRAESVSKCKIGTAQDNHHSNYNLEHKPIVCSGGVYTAKNSKIEVTKYSENPISTKGKAGEDYRRTDIKLQKMYLWGVRPSNDSGFESPIQRLLGSGDENKGSGEAAGKGSAVFVTKAGSRVRLDESNIKTFAVGLHAEQGGWITMKGGKIRNVDIGAFADSFSSIFLGHVEVDVSYYNNTSEDDTTKIGLFADNHSGIMMKSGSIIFPKMGGIGVVSRDGSAINLDKVKIKSKPGGNGTSNTGSFVFLSDTKGFISFDNGKLDISNVPLFWIRDEVSSVSKNNINSLAGVPIPEPSNEIPPIPNSNTDFHVSGGIPFVDNVSLFHEENGAHSLDKVIEAHETYGAYGAYQAKNEAFDDVVSTIKAITEGDSFFSKDSLGVSASIRSSRIRLTGDTYGIHFSKKQEEEEESRGNVGKKANLRAVLLKKSSFKVPDGVAVLGLDLNGSVILKDESVLSGRVLLEAESSSNMSIFAYNSLIGGPARVDESSNAKIFLQGSEWHLIKDKNQRLDGSKCLDSCISSITLRNSNIRFMSLGSGNNAASQGGDQADQAKQVNGGDQAKQVKQVKQVNQGYQILRIGKGDGVVFSTKGDAKVHFNANLMPSEAENSQISDRLLIHGDVDGKTKVSVHDTSNSNEKKNRIHFIAHHLFKFLERQKATVLL